MYQYTVAKDVTGNNTETEALRFRTFAEVKDGGGSLGSDHGHNSLSNEKTFKIRYRADWSTEHQMEDQVFREDCTGLRVLNGLTKDALIG
jgi:hypothetical protein